MFFFYPALCQLGATRCLASEVAECGIRFAKYEYDAMCGYRSYVLVKYRKPV